MATKRPCAICRCWFVIDPRIGKRHRVCGKEACRAARNKQACARWRREHPDEVIASRLRRQLPKAPADPPEAVVLDPMRHFEGDVVRHVMGVEGKVVLEEVAKVLACIARHEMPPKAKVRGGKDRKVLPRRRRHETAPTRAPP